MATSAPQDQPLDLMQSVAGEEDPGASVDMALPAGRADAPAADAGTGQPAGTPAPMRPGDEAPAGTPGTGESVCPRCGGSGRLAGQACPDCAGTGRVTSGIGGG